MNIKEFGTLTDAIKTYFPKDNMFPTKKSMRLWYEELKDLDYQIAAMELRKYVALNRFAPTISDIRKCLIDFSDKKELDMLEAWELVISTLKEVETKGLAKNRFNSLPELTRKAIGGYNQFLELVNNPSIRQAVKSSFSKSYKELIEKDIEMKMLQPEIGEHIKSSAIIGTETSKILQIEGEGNEKLFGDGWEEL